MSQTLNPSNPTNAMFVKVPRGNSLNPLAGTQKNITIKKILQEMEKDLREVEEENYVIVKEQAEQRMLKANPKLAASKQKQLEREQQSP